MAVPGAVGPGTGVAGSHGHHGIRLLQLLQEALVGFVVSIAGIGGTQRQVHHVAAQQNGVFYGRHVVGVISAAVFAKDLHGDELGVRGHALDLHRFQSADKSILCLYVPVCSGNPRHVGAVLALVIVVVGHIQVPVHVVVVKGQLGGAIQLLRRGGSCRGLAVLQGPLVGVQLRKYRADFRCIQKIIGFAAGLLILRQGVGKGVGIKRLVICVGTGVNDCNSHPCAGISGGVGSGGANHLTRGCHAGIGGTLGVNRWFVPGFQDDFFHARHRLNGLNLFILHIGGNQIGRQSQVPHHVQGLAPEDLIGNPPGQGRLIGLQGVTGLLHLGTDGQGGSGQAAGRFHLLQAGAVLQDDGDPNQVGRCIGRILG